MFTKHTHKNKSSFFRLKKQHLSLGYGKFKTIFDIEIFKKKIIKNKSNPEALRLDNNKIWYEF